LKRWKREDGKEAEYRRRKRKYKQLCEKKEEKERERMRKEMEQAKTERKIWKLVNKKRKRGVRIKNKEISSRN